MLDGLIGRFGRRRYIYLTAAYQGVSNHISVSMSLFYLRIVLLLVGVGVLASYQTEAPSLPLDIPQHLSEDPLTSGDQAKITVLTSSLDWLGPLAPIAISPFFGITILAGLSQFGAEYLPSNSFISHNPVLNNPTVFWVFLGLTILTSLPRFTKVSKPAAQAIDQLEAYAGIITIVLVRILSSLPESEPAVAASAGSAMVIQMGFLSFSADVLLSIAAVINILVINTVKFFFEVMVWLVPIPFVDAGLEVANKSLCAGLMAIYVWSPLVATVLNLILFVVCLLAFRWVNRRVKYLRSMLCDPIWALFSKPFGNPTRNELVVFPQSGYGPFPAKTRLLFQSTSTGWQLVQPRWFTPPKIVALSSDSYRPTIKTGMLLNSIELEANESEGATSGKLLFSKRYSKQIDKLSSLLNVEQSDGDVDVDFRTDMAKA